MNIKTKQALIKKIIVNLEQEKEALAKAALATYEAAIHEEAIAEDKYDTTGLEASYLAGAQAKRVNELEQALLSYSRVQPRDFDAQTPIALTAILKLEDDLEQHYSYFLGPAAGGMKLQAEDQEWVVITPSSPLGRRLIGSYQGDCVEIEKPRKSVEYEILSVL